MTRFQVRKKLRKASVGLVTITILAIASVQAASAAAVRTGFSGNTLAANDDNSTGLVNIGFLANFFGVSTNQLYVNNNGNVTFDAPLSSFTPVDLSSTERQIIAPFFGDVDTTGAGSQPVTYGTGTVDGRNAFGVNYNNVGYYFEGTDKLNSFQLVLIDRSDTGTGNFDIEYNYDQIQWESGDASDGIGGLGGSSARVGFSNSGAPGTSFELPGSGVNGAFLDGGSNSLVANRLNNSDVNGRYLFEARNGSVAAVPEPFTILGSLTAGAIGVALRRKRHQQQKETAKV